ncbi:hypothetical protein [Paraburkholderia xenovorans]|uniref:hypothetical protein n=1 Tax=Paraburkholderia xenovorans TaxID=36873 RepID=UPI0015C56A23|nr:hypothetical protein [Paraburkholderia xenovorans]NPT36328.1 hypothetical protein [Paraburkholderia xenovorans]
MNIEQKLDTTSIGLLTDVFADIVGAKIPAVYREHGLNSAVLENVLHLTITALNCLERIIALAAAHPPTAQAFERRAQVVRDRIEELKAEYVSWLESEAVVEAAASTKH